MAAAPVSVFRPRLIWLPTSSRFRGDAEALLVD